MNTNWITGGFAAVAVSLWGLSLYWGSEPDTFNVEQLVAEKSFKLNEKPVTGYATTTVLIETTETLLSKPGGYLSNDVTPPSAFMDNIPAWEFGALEMIRDMALIMRKDFSRSQSQSLENAQLKIAQPQFNIDSRAWMWPSAESEYSKGIEALKIYRSALANGGNPDAQFYARADNLSEWLKEVEKRLGSLSQRLSASVGQERINTDLAGDALATQSTVAPKQDLIQTSWWKIDDVFYESRGACWALIHFLKAIEVDFAPALAKKNATVSLKQIIRELESTQDTVWSPIILNGSGFGVLANHSLVMANYISRANAALIDLNELLKQG